MNILIKKKKLNIDSFHQSPPPHSLTLQHHHFHTASMASLPTRRLVIFKPTGFGFLLALWIGFVEIKAGEDYSKSLTLGNSQRPFDYFMLSLLWPATSCRSARHCCPSNACCQR